MIWLALLIPVFFAIVLWYFFAHKVVWQELLLPFAVSVVMIFICKVTSEIGQTTDYEYWTGKGLEARYYEDWNERVSCRHPRYCESCSGTGSNRSCTTYICGYYHAYDVDYHPEYWEIHESNGFTKRISQEKFTELTSRWNNNVFVDLGRHYHTNDGDMYKTNWDGNFETMEVITSMFSYENRVQATNNIYNFPEVTEEEKKQYGIWDYPPIYRDHQQPSLLGADYYSRESVLLSRLNANLGQKKQVKVFILLYKNKPLEASFKQEDYWKGGNKNELVITIGVDNENNVQWARTFSWSEKEAAKVESKEVVLSQQNKPLNLVEIVEKLGPIVEQKFVRKHFSEFDYLEVQPGPVAMFLTFFLTFIANIAASVWAVKNDITEASRERQKAWERKYRNINSTWRPRS